MKNKKFPLCMMSALLWATGLMGQDSLMSFPLTIQRLRAFGERIPQEKVYVHMDNRCYFLGDTIWFKAYTQQTNDGKPSEMSGTLYVELFDQEGYLKERKLVEMKQGQGCGFFATDTTMYGGFYELRAYTRWQLNWGEKQHERTLAEKNWFFNKTMEYEFFRDYDKLYSRVFPVYGKYTAESGHYEPASRTSRLSFFPEGGNLVAGLPSRVAFEATRWDGAYQDGMLIVGADTIPVQHRGRGCFLYTPMGNNTDSVRFVSKDGHELVQRLPYAQPAGATLRVEHCESCWLIHVNLSDAMERDSLALTLMHQGRLESFCQLLQLTDSMVWSVPDSLLCAGVHQVTLFDTGGRVWSDRLFFEKKQGMAQPTISLKGNISALAPYEKVELRVHTSSPYATISLAVHDDGQHIHNYDTGNILTELLLASEIKGFIPSPEWYFEADDSFHEAALDLLMLTQGWRRFPWREMAMPDSFRPVHPKEETPQLNASVHDYHQGKDYCPKRHNPLAEYPKPMTFGDSIIETMYAVNPSMADTVARYTYFRGKDLSSRTRRVRTGQPSLSCEEYFRLGGDGEHHPHLIRYVGDAGKDTWKGNVHDGRFSLILPRTHGHYHLSLWATCPMRWPLTKRRGPDYAHAWQMRPAVVPEYYVRISHPYPRFAGPYNYYQETLCDDAEIPTCIPSSSPPSARVIRMEAQEALNMLLDAGLIEPTFVSSAVFSRALARYYASFMGRRTSQPLPSPIGNPYGRAYEDTSLGYMTPQRAGRLYKDLSNIDSVIIRCNYSPRAENDTRYVHCSSTSIVVQLHLGNRPVRGERWLSMDGYPHSADFYHPDYSTHRPSPEQADYRRTLYWNPNLKLDAEGKAQVMFYNNARTTRLSIEAAGLSPDGTILWNKTE